MMRIKSPRGLLALLILFLALQVTFLGVSYAAAALIEIIFIRGQLVMDQVMFMMLLNGIMAAMAIEPRKNDR